MQTAAYFGCQPPNLRLKLLKSIQRPFIAMVACFQAYENTVEINVTRTTYQKWLKDTYQNIQPKKTTGKIYNITTK